MKPLFLSSASATWRLLVLVVASVALMVGDREGDAGRWLRGALLDLTYPLQRTVDAPWRAWQWGRETLLSREDLLARNRQLYLEAEQLRAELQQLRALQDENGRLAALLASTPRLPADYHFRLVRVLGIGLAPDRVAVALDAGRRQGVEPGQALLAAQGVFGQVVTAGTWSSQAIAITDASHAIPVKSERNGLRLVAAGNGPGAPLDIQFAAIDADLRSGDLLLASGLGGVFPPGFPVARVTGVLRPPGRRFAQVTAVPVAAIEQVQELLLVTSGSGALAAESTVQGKSGPVAAGGHPGVADP